MARVVARALCAALSLLLTAACGACAPGDDARAALRPESDERAFGGSRRALPDGRALVVTREGALVLEGGARRRLIDGVIGAPALLDERRAIVARATGPGESDLWIVHLDDAAARPRALAARRGADAQPFALADGRVLFVSDRTGVASVFVVDPTRAPHDPVQLTNHGERPGALSAAFVPPPIAWTGVDRARVRYHAGDREVVLDVDSAVERASDHARAEVR